MPRRNDDLKARADYILEQLRQHEYVTVSELSERLNVSAVTIRKDLTALEKRGLLRRTHGGAVSPLLRLHEPAQIKQSFRDNVRKYREQKRKIGIAAARYVQDGEAIAFGGGTTVMQIIPYISQNIQFLSVTNTLNIALELSHRQEQDIFVPGGYLSGNMYSLTGTNALNAIETLELDRMFLGIHGIHPKRGVTELLVKQARIHRALFMRAKHRIVVADSSKVGAIHKAVVCQAGEVDLLITDDGVNPAFVGELREQDIAVEVVSVNVS